jgi:hypothetical protein
MFGRESRGGRAGTRGCAVSTVAFDLDQIRRYIRDQDEADGSEGLYLAKISSAQGMARFALCLGLKRDPRLGQELL